MEALARAAELLPDPLQLVGRCTRAPACARGTGPRVVVLLSGRWARPGRPAAGHHAPAAFTATSGRPRHVIRPCVALTYGLGRRESSSAAVSELLIYACVAVRRGSRRGQLVAAEPNEPHAGTRRERDPPLVTGSASSHACKRPCRRRPPFSRRLQPALHDSMASAARPVAPCS
uniref:Uncharacterized protein n=1 Tax=Setaria viridis TaxID=4556 RepID=A0A4U6TCQ9_SETVI|nr:hypothetical protein SEVIR_8G030100v2 [Setaria viridis]